MFRKPTQAASPSDKDPSTASTNQLTGRALRETEAKFQTVEIGYVPGSTHSMSVNLVEPVGSLSRNEMAR